MLSCVLTDGCVWAELRVEEHRCTGEHYLFSSLQNTITRFHYHHQSCLFSTSVWSHVWGHIQASQNRSTCLYSLLISDQLPDRYTILMRTAENTNMDFCLMWYYHC